MEIVASDFTLGLFVFLHNVFRAHDSSLLHLSGFVQHIFHNPKSLMISNDPMSRLLSILKTNLMSYDNILVCFTKLKQEV